MPADASQPAKPDRQHVLIACGGTGGHLFPGIAVAEELRKRGHGCVLLISEKQIDALASEAYGHLRFERLPSLAMPRPWSPKMVTFLAKFTRAVLKTRMWIQKENASAVLAMGGFTSTGPLVAARLKRRVALIHESNAIPGRANKLNARFSNRVLVGWEACRKFFPSAKVEVVGTPVRPEFLDLPSAREAREFYDLAPDRFTLLVMGGSQGARGVNEAVTGMLEHLDGERVQILHITGPGDFEDVRKGYEGSAVRHCVLAFESDMPRAIAASDLAICRSGASSLNELAVAGVTAILVPYPYAADDHQTRNAEVFTEKNAALMISQKELASNSLGKTIVELAKDEERRKTMGQRMKELAPADSSARICDLIETLTH